jgi:hypothetical protein
MYDSLQHRMTQAQTKEQAMRTCEECGRKAKDVYVDHIFDDGSTFEVCEDTKACDTQRAWNERPCCGPDGGCEGCTPLWVLEQRISVCQQIEQRKTMASPIPDMPPPLPTDDEVPF